MNTRLLWSALLLVAALVGCTVTPATKLAPAPVRFGMTKADLQRNFGSPLRVEKHADGREDWYYQFGIRELQSEPIYEAETTPDESTVTVGQSFTTTTTMEEAAVHLSRSGKVFGVIPKGRVVMKE